MKLAVIFTGGGARAAYQVGVLKYLVETFPNEFRPQILCGTSAGAINTAFLAQFADDLPRGIRNLEDLWTGLHVEDIYRVSLLQFGEMLARWVYNLFFGRIHYVTRYRSIFDTKPLERLLRTAIDFRRIHANIASRKLEAVTITCTEYGTGRGVIFLQRYEPMKTWERHQRVSRQARLELEHVMASAALPLLFPAIQIQGVYYGDGSMRDKHPLSPAAKLGAQKILAIGVRAEKQEFIDPSRRYPTMATIGGTLLNSIFLDSMESDYENLDRINRLVKEQNHPTYRSIDTFHLQPTQDIGSLSVKHFPELPAFMRHVFTGFNKNKDESSSDFLSYLLFSGSYARELIDAGFADARSNHRSLETFLTSST